MADDKPHGRSESFQDKQNMIDNLGDFGMNDDDVSLSGSDMEAAMGNNDDAPTPPPAASSSNDEMQASQQSQSQAVGSLSNQNSGGGGDLEAPPAFNVNVQQLRSSQIHKAMGTMSGGSALLPEAIASESIKAEGKTAEDELDDLTHEFHKTAALSQEFDKGDLNDIIGNNNDNEMNNSNLKQMSVGARSETPPAADPSNPTTAIKEAKQAESLSNGISGIISEGNDKKIDENETAAFGATEITHANIDKRLIANGDEKTHECMVN